jgi:N-ethylmaleimide reductase
MLPVAPSAIAPAGQSVTATGMQDYVAPRPFETSEIADVVAQFKAAAAMAKSAGFDGVEVHGANGYLIDQFLRDGTNQRTDGYGGSVENRMRFLNEVIDAVADEYPISRIGVRLTPENTFNDMKDSDPQTHFSHIVAALRGRGLAYLHVLEGTMMASEQKVDYRKLRDTFDGTYIANNGYN